MRRGLLQCYRVPTDRRVQDQKHLPKTKDIDVTMEYSGSFGKDEVIHNLTTNEGFRMQGCAVDANKTILDNSDQVGNYMETVQGVTTRCKIYNKMIQMLESKSVRETVGQHWKDWVCQKSTRLAKARHLAKDRGLIRAEVTFYCAFYGGHFKAQNTIRVAFFGRFYSICRHLESIL